MDKYDKVVKSNCKIRFGKTLEELYILADKTQEEQDFLYYYEKYMPVSRAPGTMNKICWRIEDEFRSTNVMPGVEFDYSILKSNDQYTPEEFNAILQLYNEYNKNMQLFLKGAKKNDSTKEERDMFSNQLKDNFTDACYMVCPNENVLTNILVDVCYTSNQSKAFAWDIVGENIFHNVLKNNNNTIQYPIKDSNGDIEFCGKRFSLCTQKIGGDIIVDFE